MHGPRKRIQIDRDDPFSRRPERESAIPVFERDEAQVRHGDPMLIDACAIGGDAGNPRLGVKPQDTRDSRALELARNSLRPCLGAMEKIHLDLQRREPADEARDLLSSEHCDIPIHGEHGPFRSPQPLRGETLGPPRGRKAPLSEKIVECFGPTVGDETFRDDDSLAHCVGETGANSKTAVARMLRRDPGHVPRTRSEARSFGGRGLSLPVGRRDTEVCLNGGEAGFERPETLLETLHHHELQALFER